MYKKHIDMYIYVSATVPMQFVACCFHTFDNHSHLDAVTACLLLISLVSQTIWELCTVLWQCSIRRSSDFWLAFAELQLLRPMAPGFHTCAETCRMWSSSKWWHHFFTLTTLFSFLIWCCSATASWQQRCFYVYISVHECRVLLRSSELVQTQNIIES